MPLPVGASADLTSLVVGGGSGIEDHLIDARLGTAAGLFRALRLKHLPTANHCLRVALGCSAFCEHMNIDPVTRSQVEVAGLLHDVGKIGVPDHILNKPGRLDQDEIEVMAQHGSFALEILQSCCHDEGVLEIVHHAPTWFDGSYPDSCSLRGEQIPLGARILSIQNAFDAMTTDLVYRRALPRERAIAELIACSPSQFDPSLVRAFCSMLEGHGVEQQADSIRSWVDLLSSSSDAFWSLRSPLSETTVDTKSVFQQRLLDSMQDGVVFVDLSARIIVWNSGAAQLTGMSKESVHHKQWQPQIIDLRDPEGNTVKTRQCPLLECLRSQSESLLRLTLTHGVTGDRTAVQVHVMPARDHKGVSHGGILILHDLSSEQTLEERVHNLHAKATKDALTGVANRAELDRRHAEMVASHTRSGAPLSLVITDIDRFKSINDTYGHQAGDQALVAFAELIDEFSRDEDVVARYGGEEFVLLCPGCGCDSATRRAEEIRRKLAATAQPALEAKAMTASFGVTELQPGDTPESMLQRADRGLYLAKNQGRNRVVPLGAEAPQEEETRSRSWFSWGKSVMTDESIMKRTLHSNVPVKVVTEKIRGFVADHGAQVVSAKDGLVILRLDERALPTQRRHNDRPVALTIHLSLQGDPGNGTKIEAEFFTRRGRNRRLDDVFGQADRLLRSLQSYLIADEVLHY